MSEYIVEMYDECEKYVLEYGCKPTYTQGFPLREEIVRCRDCIGLVETWDGWECERFSGEYHRAEPDGFCAWAERRTDE